MKRAGEVKNHGGERGYRRNRAMASPRDVIEADFGRMFAERGGSRSIPPGGRAEQWEEGPGHRVGLRPARPRARRRAVRLAPGVDTKASTPRFARPCVRRRAGGRACREDSATTRM
ncbi:hypothetical protein GCM10009525_01430 [Streptosporangium amethystogenes subsp. fukuiense]